jgi:hypothetical protein
VIWGRSGDGEEIRSRCGGTDGAGHVSQARFKMARYFV